MYRTASLIVGNLSGLFLTVILARILKPEQFGIYSLTLSICSLALAFADLGIDGAVVRYTAYHIGKGNLEKVRGHFRYFLKIKFILAFVVSAMLILFSRTFASFFGDGKLTLPFVFAGLVVLSASFTDLLNAFFVGLQEFKYSLLRQICYEFSRWVLILPLSILFLAPGAVAGYSLAHLIAGIVLFIVLLRRYNNLVFGRAESVDEKVLSYIGLVTIAGLSGIIYANIDSIMIGYLLTPTDVGYYKAAYTIVFAIAGLLSIGNVFLPIFTQLEGKNLNLVLNRLAKYTSVVIFPLVFILLYFSEEIIRVIYGAEYLNATSAMFLLSFVLIPSAFGYLGLVFLAKELPQYPAYIKILSMILNVILNYFLILAMGIKGAALATVISRFFSEISIIILLHKILKLNVSFNTALKTFIAALIMFSALCLMPEPNSIFLGVAELCIAGVVYLLIVFSTGILNIDDIRYFSKLFRV